MSRSWVARAICAAHQDLPWIDDKRPERNQLETMAIICAGCPVITDCARYALSGVAGGFYAGVWLPWRTQYESLDIKAIRSRSKRTLKILTGERKAPKRDRHRCVDGRQSNGHTPVAF